MIVSNAASSEIIRVTWIDLDKIVDLPALRASLSAEDRERADRAATPLLHRRAVVRFAQYRDIAANVFGVSHRSITLGREADGRRFALSDDDQRRLEMSTSHCEDIGVVATSWTHKLGIDVERAFESKSPTRFRSWVASDDELREVMTLEASQRDRAFVRLWTRKEAFLKATGEGVGSGMRHLRVPLESDVWGRAYAPTLTSPEWWWYALGCKRADFDAALVASRRGRKAPKVVIACS
jgi:4'-phosphopantetheinyl transferase